MTKPSQNKNGFTLVEVILAISLGGIIMASTMTIFVTFLQIWNEDKDKKAAIEAIDGTTAFIYKFLNAQQHVVVDGKQKQLEWKKLKDSNSLNGNYVLALTARTTPMCMRSSILSCGPIALYLFHEKTLLLIGWQGKQIVKSKLSQNDESASTQFTGKFVVSDRVKEIYYAYLDKKNGSWRFETTPLKNNSISNTATLIIPDGLRIVFNNGDAEETRFVPINNFYSTKESQNFHKNER